MNQAAQEYYERKNSENKIKGWVAIYVIVGIVVNGYLTGGYWLLGTF